MQQQKHVCHGDSVKGMGKYLQKNTAIVGDRSGDR